MQFQKRFMTHYKLIILILVIFFTTHTLAQDDNPCACETTFLHCVPDEEINTLDGYWPCGNSPACTDRTYVPDCHIYMLKSSCDSLNMLPSNSGTDVITIDTDGFFDDLEDCSGELNDGRPQREEDFDTIIDCCTRRHEIAHAIFSTCPTEDPGRDRACDEAIAGDVTLSCIENTMDYVCSDNDKAKSGEHNKSCRAMCYSLMAFIAYSKTDICFCEKGQEEGEIDQGICDDCYEQCLNLSNEDLPAGCQDYGLIGSASPIPWVSNAPTSNDYLAEVCKDYKDQNVDNGHSCGSYLTSPSPYISEFPRSSHSPLPSTSPSYSPSQYATQYPTQSHALPSPSASQSPLPSFSSSPSDTPWLSPTQSMMPMWP